MNYISPNSLYCMFLVRGGHKDSWKIWKQQPFLTKGTHWCCLADFTSLVWTSSWVCNCPPSSGLPICCFHSWIRSVFISLTKGPSICRIPMSVRSGAIDQIPVELYPAQACGFQPALDLSHLVSIFLSLLPDLWILSSGIRCGDNSLHQDYLINSYNYIRSSHCNKCI